MSTVVVTVTGPAGCCCVPASGCVLCGVGYATLNVYVGVTGCVAEFIAPGGPFAWSPAAGVFAKSKVYGPGSIDIISADVGCYDTGTPRGLRPSGVVTSATLPCSTGAAATGTLGSRPVVTSGAVVCDAAGFVSQSFTFDFNAAGVVTFTVVA